MLSEQDQRWLNDLMRRARRRYWDVQDDPIEAENWRWRLRMEMNARLYFMPIVANPMDYVKVVNPA